MDARRAKIIEAQLISKGFSREEAHCAVSEGPEAVAVLNTSTGSSSTDVAVPPPPAPHPAPRPLAAVPPPASMDERRARIMEAQLISKGFSTEEAHHAVSEGSEAVALLNSKRRCVGPDLPAIARSANGYEPAAAAAPDVDVSWMFPTSTLHNNFDTTTADSTIAGTAPLTGASSDLPTLQSIAEVDISWMFVPAAPPPASLDDEVLAEEVAKTFAEEDGFAVEAFECQCCFDDVPEMTGLHMSPGLHGCDHVLCPECFKRMISGQIDNKELCTCPLCPATSPSVVPSWLVRRVLGVEMAARLSAIEQIHLEKADEGRLRLWQCPTPDCQNRQVVDRDWAPENVPLGERIVDCPCCQKRICVRCNVEEHSGFTCEQFREWLEANNSTDQSYAEMMQQGIIKPCPNCAAPILKTEGCNFMTCPTCNDPDRMCWQTGLKRYGPHGCGGGHNCH